VIVSSTEREGSEDASKASLMPASGGSWEDVEGGEQLAKSAGKQSKNRTR
tara:strand:- start:3 stop:152 length:150 start_codon:yes stop_codon:yes gene_type:complete